MKSGAVESNSGQMSPPPPPWDHPCVQHDVRFLCESWTLYYKKRILVVQLTERHLYHEFNSLFHTDLLESLELIVCVRERERELLQQLEEISRVQREERKKQRQSISELELMLKLTERTSIQETLKNCKTLSSRR